jgi:hypothetical protein
MQSLAELRSALQTAADQAGSEVIYAMPVTVSGSVISASART